MEFKIFEKIEFLLYSETNNDSIKSVDKIEYERASMHLSGNYMVIVTHDKLNNLKTSGTTFELGRIKAFKTQ